MMPLWLDIEDFEDEDLADYCPDCGFLLVACQCHENADFEDQDGYEDESEEGEYE